MKKNKKLISSTLIRKLLQTGKLNYVNKYLNRPWSIHGRVQKGRMMGKKIGFPTANLDIGESKIIPGKGVYYIEAFIGDDRLFGMCNIGLQTRKHISLML